MGNRLRAPFAFTAALKQTLQTNSGDIQMYKDKVQKLQNELIKVGTVSHSFFADSFISPNVFHDVFFIITPFSPMIVVLNTTGVWKLDIVLLDVENLFLILVLKQCFMSRFNYYHLHKVSPHFKFTQTEKD